MVCFQDGALALGVQGALTHRQCVSIPPDRFVFLIVFCHRSLKLSSCLQSGERLSNSFGCEAMHTQLQLSFTCVECGRIPPTRMWLLLQAVFLQASNGFPGKGEIAGLRSRPRACFVCSVSSRASPMRVESTEQILHHLRR